jgi:hypothetical protein
VALSGSLSRYSGGRVRGVREGAFSMDEGMYRKIPTPQPSPEYREREYGKSRGGRTRPPPYGKQRNESVGEYAHPALKF